MRQQSSKVIGGYYVTRWAEGWEGILPGPDNVRFWVRRHHEKLAGWPAHFNWMAGIDKTPIMSYGRTAADAIDSLVAIRANILNLRGTPRWSAADRELPPEE